jgi:hypothetical protein
MVFLCHFRQMLGLYCEVGCSQCTIPRPKNHPVTVVCSLPFVSLLVVAFPPSSSVPYYDARNYD